MNEPQPAGRPYPLLRSTYWVWYAVVFMAAWNAVLRPTLDIPVTPYYVLMPIICAIFVTRTTWASRWLLWLFVFACYGLAAGVAYGVPLSMQLAQLLKYAQLVTFFMLLTWLCRVDPYAPARLYSMLRLLTIMVFLIAGIQAVTGFEFPTVVNEQSSMWLNTFFFTPNDLALFLCGIWCLVLCSDTTAAKKLLFFGALIALNLRNDAKAAILALLLMAGLYVFIRTCTKLKIKPLIALIILIAFVALIMIVVNDTLISIGSAEFDFMQLFHDPFERIVNLDPYDLGGSVFDRTDALIYSISALTSTGWLGLGPAGSVYMLSQPSTQLLSASSLHNAIAEIFVEFGPAAAVVSFIVLRQYGRALWSNRPTRQQITQMVFVTAAPLLSVSQSSGYISNYAFWLTAFVVWCSPERPPPASL